MAKYLKTENGSKISKGRILCFETGRESNHYNGYYGTIYARTGKNTRTPICTLFTHNDEGQGFNAFDDKLSRKLEDIVLAMSDPTIDTYIPDSPELSSRVAGKHSDRNENIQLNQLMRNALDDSSFDYWRESCNRTHTSMNAKSGDLYRLMDKKGTIESRHFIQDTPVPYMTPLLENVSKVVVNKISMGNPMDSPTRVTDSCWYVAGASAYSRWDDKADKCSVIPGVFVQSPYQCSLKSSDGLAAHGRFGLFVDENTVGNIDSAKLAFVDDQKRLCVLDDAQSRLAVTVNDIHVLSKDSLFSECEKFVHRNVSLIEHQLEMYRENTLNKDPSLTVSDGLYQQSKSKRQFEADSASQNVFSVKGGREASEKRSVSFISVGRIKPKYVKPDALGRSGVCITVPKSFSENCLVHITVNNNRLHRDKNGDFIVDLPKDSFVRAHAIKDNAHGVYRVGTNMLSRLHDRFEDAMESHRQKATESINQHDNSNDRQLPSYQGDAAAEASNAGFELG